MARHIIHLLLLPEIMFWRIADIAMPKPSAKRSGNWPL